MSLLFPTALAARNTAVALSAGAFWCSTVMLASALAWVLIGIPGAPLPWSAAISLLVIAGGGFALRAPSTRPGAMLAGVGVAFVAAISTYTYSVLDAADPSITADALYLTSVVVAVTILGIVAGRHFGSIASLIVVFVIAEGSVLAVVVATGHQPVFDVTAVVAFAVLLVILAGLRFSRSRSRASVPTMVRAVDDDRADRERAALARSASALVHDTVLNELAVVGSSAEGPMSATARAGLERSLNAIDSRDWRDPPADTVRPELSGRTPGADHVGPLGRALTAAQDAGLSLVVGGDVGELDSLSHAAATALVRAVGECLSNVLRHSGVHSAEIVVVAAPDNLSVMVIDAGVGFDESTVAAERLGVRRSVRERIAEVDGTVQVWSSPGNGTSVVITVPRS